MKGRTYRSFSGEPLYPFGFGLSYTTFSCRNLNLPAEVKTGDKVEVMVEVGNSGRTAGEEVVDLHLTPAAPAQPMPVSWLAGFERVKLHAGERKKVSFSLTARRFAVIAADGRRVVTPGTFEVLAGGRQPGADTANKGLLSKRLRIGGTARELE